MNQSTLLENASGAMPYTLTNDYLFRALLQRSNTVLKGLICSLLHLSPEEVLSAEIINPIELGRNIDSKTFFLDIRVLLNNHTSINIEMQVLNLGNWPERSLSYLCRSFDSLNRGQNYIDLKPVVQICFLDFTLFPEEPEFYASYMFANVQTHKIYSDRLKLSVVDLTQIHLATEEDRLHGIDHWARLFKSTTWEEIKMLAANNDYMKEAAETVYQLTAEEEIRLQCEAREEYFRQERYTQALLEQKEEALAKCQQELEKYKKAYEELLKKQSPDPCRLSTASSDNSHPR